MALHFFITHDWKFINDAAVALENFPQGEDKKNFSYEGYDVNPYDYFINATLGSKQYLLKEDMSAMEHARRHSRRFIFYSFCLYFLNFNLFLECSTYILPSARYFI